MTFVKLTLKGREPDESVIYVNVYQIGSIFTWKGSTYIDLMHEGEDAVVVTESVEEVLALLNTHILSKEMTQ